MLRRMRDVLKTVRFHKYVIEYQLPVDLSLCFPQANRPQGSGQSQSGRYRPRGPSQGRPGGQSSEHAQNPSGNRGERSLTELDVITGYSCH